MGRWSELVQPPTLQAERSDTGRAATWLELFFDLAFIFVIAELALALGKDLTPGGVRDFTVLFFTDGVVEERMPDGEQFGVARLRDLVERAGAEAGSLQETVRRLSHALMAARDGRTTDDATLLLIEWAGPGRHDELP